MFEYGLEPMDYVIIIENYSELEDENVTCHLP